jgi:2-polyprenyl-3-methyl-5-hydroxy-6-metoxy-1,4-benzoquinol methylase
MNTIIETEENKMRDEQFCQSFELKALADLLIRRESERWVSGFADVFVEKEHSSRYEWILQFVSNKTVLDIACGIGKGSNLMAIEGGANEVVGCDLDPDAIKYASIRHKHPNVSFVNHDAQTFQDERKFDVIVSFETIEHLPNVELFLNRMKELLKADGKIFISTPISKKSFDTDPHNPYHFQEWGFREFQNLISKYFFIEDIYLQMRNNLSNSLKDRFVRKIYRIIENTLISRIIENKSLKRVKNKYVGIGNEMRPIRFDKSDEILFNDDVDDTDVVGYQILVAKNINY